MTNTHTRRITLGLAAALLAAFAAAPVASAGGDIGAVYAITNAPGGNAVVAWNRHADGSLSYDDTYATGGTGTGAGLGSQGAVTVSDDRTLLFAVNGGSNDISSFRITGDGLVLADREPSGGSLPNSVAVFDGLVYVLNSGVPNNVSGFTVTSDGDLSPIAGSARPLSAAATTPSQVGFSADGDVLVVTERATSRISTFVVEDDGTLDGPQVHPSAGPAPFGFAISKRDTLFVSEAGTGGGASTYSIEADGGLGAGSSNLMTGQRAACWAVVTGNGRFGYVTNAGTGNISGFALNPDGTAALLDADGVTATTGGNPTDAAISHNSQFLYVRVAALGSITIFRIAADGSLAELPALTGTPDGLAGLAGW